MKPILNTLRRLFANEGYIIYTAQNGEEGLKIVTEKEVNLIISDQNMPGMSGIEFLERTVGNHPDIIRIILTGHAELDDAIRAVNSGCVYKFIQKPWNNEDLKITVRRALEQYNLIMKNRDLTTELKNRDKIIEELERKHPGITKKPDDGIYQINVEK